MSECSDKSVILFENLVNRLALDDKTGQYSLSGVITDDERTALLVAQRLMTQSQAEILAGDIVIGPAQDDFQLQPQPESLVEVTRTESVVTGSPVSGENGVASIPSDIASTKSDPPSSVIDAAPISSWGIETLLDLSVLNPGDFLPHLKLGLDFGTAYSKACIVSVENDEEVILDLPLGIFAGEDSLEMPVHSSLFIDPDGRLYFGPIAVEKSLEARSAGAEVSRVDSIKSFLIEENRVTIDDSPLSDAYNPTDTNVSKAALLTFYLGYLLQLVRAAASERHGIDISNVIQRISLPCYEPSHRDKVIKELSKLLTLGEVLGKSFQEEWEKGFRIQDVMYLYEWMRANIKKKTPYVERFLEEPLAVAGSRLSINGKSLGNVCMVVDVGAGTTDFTMFEIFADAKEGRCAANVVKGSEYGVPIAGDKLDTILLAYILKNAGVTRASENYKEVLVSLRLDIRNYKERLFIANVLTYALPNGITGQVMLSDFLKEKTVKDYSKELHKAFVHVLSSIHPSWIKTKIRKRNTQSKLPVILTGGGAGLPMVRNLAKGVIDVHGHQVNLYLSPTLPKWLEDGYEGEIINLYPQMSVALGSAKQFVIEKTGVQEICADA